VEADLGPGRADLGDPRKYRGAGRHNVARQAPPGMMPTGGAGGGRGEGRGWRFPEATREAEPVRGRICCGVLASVANSQFGRRVARPSECQRRGSNPRGSV
jgi:hypothetical protein